jgi:hypothetical protein
MLGHGSQDISHQTTIASAAIMGREEEGSFSDIRRRGDHCELIVEEGYRGKGGR